MSLLSGRILVTGGGTAGWLAAPILRDAQPRAGQGGGGRAGTVTVVESSKVPTIGVGEGTTAVFRQMPQHPGPDEAGFMAATGAMVKCGIRRRDERRIGHRYDGPQLVAPGVPLARYLVGACRRASHRRLGHRERLDPPNCSIQRPMPSACSTGTSSRPGRRRRAIRARRPGIIR